ncbi:Bud site selection protein 6 [Boothiomyces macroporosus]|uniref:Bud site selection protein 6 n=1 Tax=Boothiomyces macroporosus TaxID=261099 RepID=A0AAD5UFX7_9FUNG|nr:Bud site selection protein 6 [Boothiomyces macroporosus]
MLTKIQSDGQGKISVLKRLHLAPEQIRHDIDMILYTNSPDKIRSCIKAINQVLKDVETLTHVGTVEETFPSDPIEKVTTLLGTSKARGGLVGHRYHIDDCLQPKEMERHSSKEECKSKRPRSKDESTLYKEPKVNFETPCLNISEDFGKLTAEFERALESKSKTDKQERGENSKSKIRVLSNSPSSVDVSGVKSILRNNSDVSQESVETIQILDVFLKYQNLTKKSKWSINDGIEGLKNLFVLNFEGLPPKFQVLLQDSNYNKFYALTDTKDVCNGSLLTIQQSTYEKEADGFQVLGRKLDRLTDMVESRLTGRSNPHEATSKKKSAKFNEYLNQISGLKKDLESLEELSSSNFNDLYNTVATQIQFLKTAFKKTRKSDIEQYAVETSSLMEDFKDFMFFLDTTRIDLTRKVRPGEHYKSKIEQKMAALLSRQNTLRNNLTALKGSYKKQWENSLQSVLSEQQALSDLLDRLGDIDEISSLNVDLANSVLPVLEHQLETRDRGLKKPQITVWSADQVKNYGMELIVAELNEKDYNVDRSHVLAIVEAQKKNKLPQDNPFVISLSSAKLNNVGGVEKLEMELEKKKRILLKELFKGNHK